MSRRRTLELLAFSLLCVLVLPRMTDRGMFLDGVTYAAIARNLSIGEGTFWRPYYTQTVYPEFHEQPPLGLAAEAVFFRIFGDHFFVERAYSFAIGVICFTLIMWTWRKANGDAGLQWMPALLWVVTPLVSWCLVNNMLENTQTAFALLAVGSAVAGLQATRLGSALFWGGLSGGAVAASVLVKGPVGLFPLVVPWSHGFVRLALGRGRGAAGSVAATGVSQLIAGGAVAAALFAHGPARESLAAYISQQLVPTVAGARETSDSRSRFATKLAGDLAPMTVLAMVPLGVAWRRRRPLHIAPDDRALAFMWLVVALAASVPLLISPKQSGHYLLPSIPFFALALSALSARPATALLGESRTAPPIARALALILIAISVLLPATRWKVEARDGERLDDLDRVFAVAPEASTLHVCEAASQDWGLHAYAQRYWRASLDQTSEHRWALVPRVQSCAAPDGCVRAALETRTMDLYECASR